MRFLSALLLIFMVSCSCATTVPEILKIKAHEQYEELTSNEMKLVEDIMDKIIDTDRKDYYFSKLTLLLDTQTNPPAETRKLNREEISRSVKESKRERREIAKRNKSDLEEYLSREEFYENAMVREWTGYKPEFLGPFFYVVDNNPIDILIHIKVRLHGSFDIISKVILLEDAIEKHLKIPGYSVNLVFVGHSSDEGDVFDVDVDPGRWTTSHNWAGSHKALAHELLHLMGLPDEYNRIESHASNKNMTRYNRLHQFIIQMDDEVPADSSQGIMCYYNLKPLERHVCTSVGLGPECVRARMKIFHEEE